MFQGHLRISKVCWIRGTQEKSLYQIPPCESNPQTLFSSWSRNSAVSGLCKDSAVKKARLIFTRSLLNLYSYCLRWALHLVLWQFCLDSWSDLSSKHFFLSLGKQNLRKGSIFHSHCSNLHYRLSRYFCFGWHHISSRGRHTDIPYHCNSLTNVIYFMEKVAMSTKKENGLFRTRDNVIVYQSND